MNQTEQRKMEHIRICLEKKVDTGDPLFDEVTLVHQTLNDLDLEAVDCSQTFLGKRLDFPLLIAGMTGGCREAREINLALAGAAERKGVAFGVGSQRAMIENPDLTDTFAVREAAPTTPLLGNLGITALRKYPLSRVHQAVESIGADALCVHINPAQELFQHEGDLDFSGCPEALRRLCEDAGYPVIAKEVGTGTRRESALLPEQWGGLAIDLGGLGGTSWVLVDSIRSGMDSSRFRVWGIPTAASILEAGVAGVPLIATGGVRNGLHMAKAVLLGADLCGIALPFIRILDQKGVEGVDGYIDTLKREFRYALYLTGSVNVADFRRKKPVLGARILEWVRQRELAL